VGRSLTAARQLASRARRRVHGAAKVPDPDPSGQRKVVDAFLAAARGGDFDALLAVLDPDVVVRADRGAVSAGGTTELRGGARSRRTGTHIFAARSVRTAGARERSRRHRIVASRRTAILGHGIYDQRWEDRRNQHPS
jgi:hypothetical protein